MNKSKRTLLLTVLLIALGFGAYYLSGTELFKGLILTQDEVATELDGKVSVRTDCDDGFCSWPMKTSEESSFDVSADATFTSSPEHGTIRALEANADVVVTELIAPDGSTKTIVTINDTSKSVNTTITSVGVGYSAGSEMGELTVEPGFGGEQLAVFDQPHDEINVKVRVGVADPDGRTDSNSIKLTIPATVVETPQQALACFYGVSAKATEYGALGFFINTEGFMRELMKDTDLEWSWTTNVTTDPEVIDGGIYMESDDIAGVGTTFSYVDLTQSGTAFELDLEVTSSTDPAFTYSASCELRGGDTTGTVKRPSGKTPLEGDIIVPTLDAPRGASAKDFMKLSSLDAMKMLEAPETRTILVPVVGGLERPADTDRTPATIEPPVDSSPAPDVDTSVVATGEYSEVVNAAAGSTVYYEAECLTQENALRISIPVDVASARYRRAIGVSQVELDIDTGAENCDPVEELPNIVAACKVNPTDILVGDAVIFSGQGSSGDYTGGLLDFGDGTVLELAVADLSGPVADLDPRDPDDLEIPERPDRPARPDGVVMGERMFISSDIAVVAEKAYPTGDISVKDISVFENLDKVDEVVGYQEHTYTAAGTYGVTLILTDANQNVSEASCGTVFVSEPTDDPAECADGIDNDQDGLIDYDLRDGDPGCESPNDDDESDDPEENIVVDSPNLPFCLVYKSGESYSDISNKDHAYSVIQEESDTAYGGLYVPFIDDAIVHGYPGDSGDRVFRPDQGVLKSEAGKMIMHATCFADSLIEMGTLDDSNVPYRDVSPSHWAKEIINIMSNAGVFDASLDNNNPDTHATKAEFVKMLIEVHNQTTGDELHPFDPATNPFVDIEAGAWYADYVQTAWELGVAEGFTDDFGNYRFGPNRITRREDAAIWVYNYFGVVADASFADKRLQRINEVADPEPEEDNRVRRTAPISR